MRTNLYWSNMLYRINMSGLPHVLGQGNIGCVFPGVIKLSDGFQTIFRKA